MEDSLNAYRERVQAMHPDRRAALLRNHDALIANVKRWSALGPELRAHLSAMIEVVREQEESNG